MKNNKTVYFPACSAGAQLAIITENQKHFKLDKTLNIWATDTKDKVYNYPNILISAGHNYKEQEFTKKCHMDTEKNLILGDSGGFQLCTGVLKYEEAIVETIFNWLENNTTYALNIDFPPYLNFVKGANIDEEDANRFQNRLDISAKNFKYFKDHDSNKTKFMNVLHGRDLSDLNIWYERVKDFDFPGGWAVGSVRSFNFYYILLNFFYLLEKGELHKLSGKGALIHFLGFSRIREIAYVIYLQKLLNEHDIDIRITFDSSSPFLTCAYGTYNLFPYRDGLQSTIISHNFIGDDKMNTDVPLPCVCPVCRSLKYKDFIENAVEKKNGKTSYPTLVYGHMGVHNLYILLEFKKKMESIILLNNQEVLEDFFGANTLKIFKVIKRLFESEHPTRDIHQFRELLNVVGNGKDDAKNKEVDIF